MEPSDNQSDDALIQAARQGDEAAFEALYRRHRDWVLRTALRFVGDEQDALDVLQETFAYVLRKMTWGRAADASPEFRLTAKFTTFLYPAVKHLSLALLRRKKRALSDDDALRLVPAAPAPESNLTDLFEVVRVLPEPQRETLILRFVDGLSLAEIARALEVPIGTVKSRLHNALNALRGDPKTRRYFGEYGDEPQSRNGR